MPISKSQKRLLDYATQKVSEQIVNFCVESRNIQVADLVGNQETNGITGFLNLQIPNTLEETVLQNSLRIWKQAKSKNENLSENEEAKINNLIHYICLRKNSEWNYELKNADTENINFLLQFNQNLHELKISVKVDPDTLVQMLTAMESITVLDLNYKISEDDVSIVAKLCRNLQKLRILESGPYAKPVKAKLVEILCFKDYPSKTIKNPIVESLQFLDIHCDDDAIIVILKNFRKLKTLINDKEVLSYNNVAEDPEIYGKHEFPYCLESISVDLYTKGDNLVRDVVHNFTNLKSLVAVNSSDLKIIEFVPDTFQSLEVQSYAKNKEITLKFPSVWPRLRKLVLEFTFSEDVKIIDFSDISRHCPNLEILSVKNCDHKPEEPLKPPFQNLTKLLIKQQGNLEISELLSHVSTSLVVLGIIDEYYETEIDLTKYSFPLLEKLFCDILMGVEEEKIIELLEHCPVLKTFGTAGQYITDFELEEQCKLKGWDLEILTNSSPEDFFM